jgi:hypothetical protein
MFWAIVTVCLQALVWLFLIAIAVGVICLVLLVLISPLLLVCYICNLFLPKTDADVLPEQSRPERPERCSSSAPMAVLGLGFLLGWWSDSGDS